MATTQPIDRSWYPIPVGNAICPVCEGSGTVPLTEKELTYSWNKGYTHRRCTNCGGQTMDGKAMGYTKIDPKTGLGCHHDYSSQTIGRCYHRYTCKKCGSQHDIDSGD